MGFMMVAGSANGGLTELGVPGRRARDALWATKASKSLCGLVQLALGLLRWVRRVLR